MPYADPQKQRDWYQQNRERVLQRRRDHYNSNRLSKLEYQKKYANEHREERKEYIREYDRKRCAIDIQYWIAKRLRSRLNIAIRNKHGASAVRDLGCTLSEFTKWIENQFRDGMTWDNRGTHWHLDHKKPLAKYDLTDPQQLAEASHYTNLQPLLVAENLSKWAN